jgi:hypothetical protein
MVKVTVTSHNQCLIPVHLDVKARIAKRRNLGSLQPITIQFFPHPVEVCWKDQLEELLNLLCIPGTPDCHAAETTA